MALSVVQTTGITSLGAGPTSYAATFASATTAGNLLVALMGIGSSSATMATDAADTWTILEGGSILANSKMEMWYVASCVGGKTGYTFTRSTAGTGSLILAEIAGAVASPFDVSTHTAGTTSTTITTGSTASTAQANEIWIAGFFGSENITGAGTGTLSGLTAGYTLDIQNAPTTGSTTNVVIGLAHQVVSSTGTASASVTISAAPTGQCGLLVTFSGSAGGGGPDPFPVGYPTAQLASAVYRM